MNLAAQIAVMVALSEGKVVERCDDMTGDFMEEHQEWEMVGRDHDFNFEEWVYRIQPPPLREWWVPVYKNGACGYAVLNKQEKNQSDPRYINEWVKVKEVRE